MNKLFRKIISNKELKDESNKTSFLHYFEERLNEFHSEFIDTEVKVTSSNYVADRLLANLEALFLHGLKETFISQLSTVVGNDVDKSMDINFWHCLLVLSPSGIVNQINSLKHITTDVGKCRAWIRSTLNDGAFYSYLESVVKCRQYITKYYNKTAIIRDHESFGKIIALLKGIDQYYFDLTLNSSLLNTWPNSTLLMAGHWTPALRNNPLYNNNPQVAEAIDASDTDEAIVINDRNLSEESYPSSLSSSLVDSEIRSKPPIMMDEEFAWRLIMKRASNLYTISSNTKEIISVEEKKEMPSSSSSSSSKIAIEPSETITKIEENHILETSTSEQRVENVPTEKTMNVDQSFGALLESYSSKKGSVNYPSVTDLVEKLSTVPKIIEEKHFNEHELTDDDGSFETLHPDHLDLDLLKQYLEYLFKPPKELGLNSQDFMCKSCNETIGIDFGNYFTCSFTASYYCVHCFGTETSAIPVKILFDWDFRCYPVSRKSATFLSEIQYHPLFNMKNIHHKLYKANKEMIRSKKLRWQIYSLYHYLSTCKFYNIEELSKVMWPRVYFFNHIHLYSFADLLEIYSGTLFEFLESKIESSREHVYSCVMCSQKGFICEICRDLKIIYPFDVVDNYRCRHCKSVLHRNCFNEKELCPKCERDKIRKMKSTTSSKDGEENNGNS